MKMPKKILEQLNRPIDKECFLYAVDIFQNAAALKMPSVNPQEKKLVFDDSTISFTDIPLNRGMLAVVDEMKEVISEEDRYSLLHRLLCIGDIIQWSEISDWLKKDEEDPENLQISQSLLYAIAECKINRQGKCVKSHLVELCKHYDQVFMDGE